ncbi:MAG: hypothetical protein GY737_09380 [Desulfobacteraceae bacterium]|nr:hypothetical protein [Desulfobacteraceae bacterium]
MRYSNITFQTFLPNNATGETFDPVLFNDEDGDASNQSEQEKIEEHLAGYPLDTVRLYFGLKYSINRNRPDINKVIKDITTFANARTQLYGNLMNALRYQDGLLKNK